MTLHKQESSDKARKECHEAPQQAVRQCTLCCCFKQLEEFGHSAADGIFRKTLCLRCDAIRRRAYKVGKLLLPDIHRSYSNGFLAGVLGITQERLLDGPLPADWGYQTSDPNSENAQLQDCRMCRRKRFANDGDALGTLTYCGDCNLIKTRAQKRGHQVQYVVDAFKSGTAKELFGDSYHEIVTGTRFDPNHTQTQAAPPTPGEDADMEAAEALNMMKGIGTAPDPSDSPPPKPAAPIPAPQARSTQGAGKAASERGAQPPGPHAPSSVTKRATDHGASSADCAVKATHIKPPRPSIITDEEYERAERYKLGLRAKGSLGTRLAARPKPDAHSSAGGGTGRAAAAPAIRYECRVARPTPAGVPNVGQLSRVPAVSGRGADDVTPHLKYQCCTLHSGSTPASLQPARERSNGAVPCSNKIAKASVSPCASERQGEPADADAKGLAKQGPPKVSARSVLLSEHAKFVRMFASVTKEMYQLSGAALLEAKQQAAELQEHLVELSKQIESL